MFNVNGILFEGLWLFLKNVGLKNAQAPEGFEPSAFCLLGRRSNQLSYGAMSLATSDIDNLMTDK